MKKVVVTGYGIISCIGNSKKEVIESLKDGKSGISLNQSYVDMGFRSHVSGSINLKLEDLIDRKLLRFMSHASAAIGPKKPRLCRRQKRRYTGSVLIYTSKNTTRHTSRLVIK